MNKERNAQLDDELCAALQLPRLVQPLTARIPELTVTDAYAIQRRFVQQRLDAGEHPDSATSRAVQRQLGVDQPDFGQLTSRMGIGDRAEVDMAAS